MKKYKIIVNEEQMHIIEEALDVLSRLGTKQYSMVLEHIEPLSDRKEFKYGISWDHKNALQQAIRAAEGCDLPSNAAYGIYQEEISDSFRVAWDLLQVLRYTRSWANAEHKPEERREHFTKYMTVNYDTPIKSSQQPLADCEEI
jgi:hypothetical protein